MGIFLESCAVGRRQEREGLIALHATSQVPLARQSIKHGRRCFHRRGSAGASPWWSRGARAALEKRGRRLVLAAARIGTLHRARRRRRGLRRPLRGAERRHGGPWRSEYYGGADADRLARRCGGEQLDENRVIAYGNNDEGRCLLASPLYEDALADPSVGRAPEPLQQVRWPASWILRKRAHAHALSIVHGDVKPANVARKHRNEPWVLLDWDDALDVGSCTS